MTKNKQNLKILAKKTITLPLIPVREIVIFPSNNMPFIIGRKRSLNALAKSLASDKLIFVSTQKHANVDDPGNKDIYNVGVIGRIVSEMDMRSQMVKVIFEGIKVAKIITFDFAKDLTMVTVTPIKKPVARDKAYIDNISLLIKSQFKDYFKRHYNHVPDDLDLILSLEKDPTTICYRLAPALLVDTKEKQLILEMNNLKNMLDYIYQYLIKEAETYKIEKSTKEKIKNQIKRNQREYYLNEQMRAIQKELGGKDQKDEWQIFETKIRATGMPKAVLDVCLKELKKLKQIPALSSEANIVRSYLECLINLPWSHKTKDNFNLKDSQKILDEDHYSLTEVKERILDFIALALRTNKLKGPILCFTGPPGVGKTSLAKSISRALGRNFARMSLGGVKDEAEILGHRRTYIGALPGKIINAMKKAKSINPIILLDEIDKTSSTHISNPAASLLEVLDPEQNSSFVDHYLEVEYDLSNVMFICTSNNVQDIPYALRDRLEIISLTGYSETEKLKISKKHLLPKLINEAGLKKNQITISPLSIRKIIRNYTKEAGIRDLKRTLAKLIRKVNRQLLTNEEGEKKVSIKEKDLIIHLKGAKFRQHKIEKLHRVGIVNGLAWTTLGGEMLIIEALTTPGTGKLMLTGSLGDVMIESAKAALSFVRAHSGRFGIDDKIFTTKNIHLHAPEGAVPKDGPSAGVALATALVSVLTKIPIKNDLAMTGEITLRGRILPIGGLKEKLLAASRANIKKVIICKDNLIDLDDLEKDAKEDLKDIEIRAVSSLFDFIYEALLVAPQPISSSPSKVSVSPMDKEDSEQTIGKSDIETN
ncbi:MAG: endopeptidase La [SAR324 cluster bacterium]|nr:endopeptidase La [SAR324 cluster bacterium]